MRTHIEKEYASRQTAVVKAEKLAQKIARRLQFSESDQMDIAIAVTEAVNNAVEHGNLLQVEKRVTLRMECDERELRIVVRDQGAGFDPAQVVDPLKPENLIKPDGRGLLILRSLMDRVDVRSSATGTEVIMVKKR